MPRFDLIEGSTEGYVCTVIDSPLPREGDIFAVDDADHGRFVYEVLGPALHVVAKDSLEYHRSLIEIPVKRLEK